jgi:hypothetical protein
MTEDTTAEKLLCAELSMLLGNITHRQRRYLTDGFRIPFAEFAARCCDDDSRLARRVLLRTGWVPAGDGEWIVGKGIHPLDKATDWETLETVCETILDTYRPIEDGASRAA